MIALTGAASGEPSGVVIVALPATDDPVHALADEDPHVTLLYLGEAAQLPQGALEVALANVELLAGELGPFPVSVSGAAVLGEDAARVLLVEAEALTRLRELLLTSPELATAARDAEHPSWIAHLTLSYSEAVDLADADDLETVEIAALAVWAGSQRHVFPLTGRTRSTVRPEWDDETLTAALTGAAGASFPSARTRDELPLLIRIADRTPAARWYCIKRASVLGGLDLLPDWPETRETVVNVGQVAARITASGNLVNVATGAPVGALPPTRRQRRQQAVDRPITDRPSLLSAIRHEPTDPARRRELVEIAQKFDRVDWVPDAWPEKPYPVAPGAAVVIRHDARSWERP